MIKFVLWSIIIISEPKNLLSALCVLQEKQITQTINFQILGGGGGGGGGGVLLKGPIVAPSLVGGVCTFTTHWDLVIS